VQGDVQRAFGRPTVLLALFARSDNPRQRAAALCVCALGVVVAVAFLRRWLPGLHLPCLRD